MVTGVGSVSKHSILDSSFPVLLPAHAALFLSESEFRAFITHEICYPNLTELEQEIKTIDTEEARPTTEKGTVSAAGLKRRASKEADSLRPQKAPFIEGLKKHAAYDRSLLDLAIKNKGLTDNADLTHLSSKNAIVDLFYDLRENIQSSKLKTLLDAAWSEDAELTLKLIFNARSIHLGKSSRVSAYKALGWLADNHPLTLLASLRWLVRPVIDKRATQTLDKVKDKEDEDDFDMVDVDEADPDKAHDICYGVSHGYWKDLLNLIVFAAHKQLTCDLEPSDLLNQKAEKNNSGKRKRDWDHSIAKGLRHLKKKVQNERVQILLKTDAFYRALHFSVARLFAGQLKVDKALLDSGRKSDLKKISLAAKWAPTFGEFHDKNTFILSSIAEILFPDPVKFCPDATNRELYLRHVRELCRKQYVSPLRAALSIVERDIAARSFHNIKYERVPSLAMNRYTSLFTKKDHEHFSQYVRNVAQGTAKISGATLLPSTLVSKARNYGQRASSGRKPSDFKAAKAAAEVEILTSILDGQWKTLVQRVREAGTLQSSIAVCDVSGSMSGPRFNDGSCPMDSAIGLSLLIAEATAAPFGGGIITFSDTPTYLSVGSEQDPRGLVDKVTYIQRASWSMSTNFVAVFEDVILPMATANNLSQGDMVKQIFVFSDMQFNSAQQGADRWTSSYERIKSKYKAAGYEMPRLIFWNLAPYHTSKPVTMDDVNTALVSGYSQGMLRAFLESGAFEEEEEVVVKDEEDGVVEVRKETKKLDALGVVKKAVENKAYDMLEVVD